MAVCKASFNLFSSSSFSLIFLLLSLDFSLVSFLINLVSLFFLLQALLSLDLKAMTFFLKNAEFDLKVLYCGQRAVVHDGRVDAEVVLR